MIDISELMDDPDLAQPIKVERAAGFYDAGRWKKASPEFPKGFIGIIHPASQEDRLEVAPEGSRRSNMIVCYSASAFKFDDGNKEQSDIVHWNGGKYRIMAIRPWQDHGYFKIWAEGFA